MTSGLNMSFDRVLLLIVIIFLATTCTGTLSSIVETRQTSFSTQYTTTAPGVAITRSLRLVEESDENAKVAGERNSLGDEERVNSASAAVLSKVAENIKMRIKLDWWQTWGRSNNYVKKKLDMENLKGAQLENHPNFRYYLKYADRVETFELWQKADGFTTYHVWKDLGLEDKIKSVNDLEKFRHTNEFRKYKRFVNIFDKNMIDNVLSWGNVPLNFPPTYVDKSASHVEKMARAEIWGESKRTNNYVKEILGLMRANTKTLSENEYYQRYLSVFKVTREAPAKGEDVAALKTFLLAA